MFRCHFITFRHFKQQQHGSNIKIFTACNHNGKREVDQPGTKATTVLHIVIKHISVKIVGASCILSIKIKEEKHFLRTIVLIITITLNLGVREHNRLLEIIL